MKKHCQHSSYVKFKIYIICLTGLSNKHEYYAVMVIGKYQGWY